MFQLVQVNLFLDCHLMFLSRVQNKKLMTSGQKSKHTIKINGGLYNKN